MTAVDSDGRRLLLRVSIEAVPIAKERPRVGAGGRTFTPPRTRHYENVVAWHMATAMRGRGPTTDQVLVCADFWLPTRRRVDVDNLGKALLDGMAGVWADDSQVYELRAAKHHGAAATARTDVEVWVLPGPAAPVTHAPEWTP